MLKTKCERTTFTISENQKQVINSNTEATKDEKDEAIERLNNELNTSTTQINNASHNSEVDGILNNSEPKIEAITPQARKKRSAIDEIGAKVNAQNSEVDKNKEATLEERNDALNKINQAYEEVRLTLKMPKLMMKLTMLKIQVYKNCINTTIY